MTQTREDWLQQATFDLRHLFDAVGAQLPDKIRISTGWSKRAKKGSIGWTWPRSASPDDTNNVFISPEIEDTMKVLQILVHELCHVSDDCESGHKGQFAESMRALGMQSPMTDSIAGPELMAQLADLSRSLGDYPHKRISTVSAHDDKKQTTRMKKIVCPDDGYTVRTTRKWLDALGTPTCPCGLEMHEE